MFCFILTYVVLFLFNLFMVINILLLLLMTIAVLLGLYFANQNLKSLILCEISLL